MPVGLGGRDGLPGDSGPGDTFGLDGRDGLPGDGGPGGTLGLGGGDGLPGDGGLGLGGLGGNATGLPVALFAMIKAVSAPVAGKTVPTEALKWQLPLL